MSTVLDFIGLGVHPEQANRIGKTPTALTTTGTTAGTAALIKSKVVVLTTAGSQTGAILPADAELGAIYYVCNSTSTGGVVYPPTGCTFNTSASTSFALAQYVTGIFIRTSATSFLALLGT